MKEAFVKLQDFRYEQTVKDYEQLQKQNAKLKVELEAAKKLAGTPTRKQPQRKAATAKVSPPAGIVTSSIGKPKKAKGTTKTPSNPSSDAEA